MPREMFEFFRSLKRYFQPSLVEITFYGSLLYFLRGEHFAKELLLHKKAIFLVMRRPTHS